MSNLVRAGNVSRTGNVSLAQRKGFSHSGFPLLRMSAKQTGRDCSSSKINIS